VVKDALEFARRIQEKSYDDRDGMDHAIVVWDEF
jgi:hypothetical protein